MIGVGMMIANLPLLFTNGNPIALSTITVRDLEKFITFMVTCSWGHDTARNIKQPPWWPEDVVFCHPFHAPLEPPSHWKKKLKRLVMKCYDYHKSTFLLVFSAQLARYPRKLLRYVDNRDHTTSVYYNRTGRLLVTFRNENLFYDRKITPITKKPIRVEPQVKSADIYLCDNCDSHFDNINVLLSHERLCNNECVPSSTCSGGIEEFLAALKLQSVNQKSENIPTHVSEGRPRTVRTAANIDRGPPYPFSSLAYLKNVKSNVQRDLSYSRERVERYCCGIPTFSNKHFLSKGKNIPFPVRYRRPIDYWHRKHTFPCQRNKQILSLKSQLLLAKCKPVKIKIDRMSLESMQSYIDKLKEESQSKLNSVAKDIEFVAGFEGDVTTETDNIKADPLHRNEINSEEVIDLCSDDEAPSTNENWDPRAGVACVMRGGAVLRRTASTPFVLPDEPCGARQHPVPTTILQRHPVILFTQSLVNMQTISID